MFASLHNVDALQQSNRLNLRPSSCRSFPEAWSSRVQCCQACRSGNAIQLHQRRVGPRMKRHAFTGSMLHDLKNGCHKMFLQAAGLTTVKPRVVSESVGIHLFPCRHLAPATQSLINLLHATCKPGITHLWTSWSMRESKLHRNRPMHHALYESQLQARSW